MVSVIKCGGCGWVSVDPKKYSGICPRCGEPILAVTCSRCGYEWMPRKKNGLPVTCPRCKSPYWCKQRVRPTEYNCDGTDGINGMRE